MPKLPAGWAQINFPAPESWKDAAKTLQARLMSEGERISLEEACRRLYRRGAESEGVWTGEPSQSG